MSSMRCARLAGSFTGLRWISRQKERWGTAPREATMILPPRRRSANPSTLSHLTTHSIRLSLQPSTPRESSQTRPRLQTVTASVRSNIRQTYRGSRQDKMPPSREFIRWLFSGGCLRLRKLAAAFVRLWKALLSPTKKAANHKHVRPRFPAPPAGVLGLTFTAYPIVLERVTFLTIRPLD